MADNITPMKMNEGLEDGKLPINATVEERVFFEKMERPDSPKVLRIKLVTKVTGYTKRE